MDYEYPSHLKNAERKKGKLKPLTSVKEVKAAIKNLQTELGTYVIMIIVN